MITPVTAIPSITNDEQLQDWMAMMLLCDWRLQQVNVVQERKFLLDAEMQIDALWSTVRNGGCGLGIIVEDVKEVIGDGFADADSPIYDLVFGFVALEERNSNFTPNVGTGITARQAGRIVVDLFYQENIQPFGQVFAKGQVNEPATDWIQEESGIYARRTTLKMKNPAKRTPRCDLLMINQAAGVVTLTCSSPAPGLQIWYTTDGTYPANSKAINTSTQLYAGAFAAEPGTVVTAAAYAPGLNQSAVKQLTVV